MVVDNSSSTEVAAVVAECGATYTDAGDNLGFGSAVNLALATILLGDPVDVLLLNPDSEISGDDVLALQAFLHVPEHERVAVVSPRLVGPDGAQQRESWPFPSPVRAWLEAIGLGRLNRAQDFVVGTVPLIRWEALREVGLFDEQFFLYSEETDWQRRAAELGWRSLVCPQVVARHVGGATSTVSLRREQLFHAGAETYVRKWFGPAGWLAYRAALVTGSAVRGVLLPGDRGAEAWQRAGLYLRGPRRVAGMASG
jgi:GT2 family glycosyltransferase